MADLPIEPQLRRWLITLFDRFAEATGRTPVSIGVKVCGGDGYFYRGLIGGEKTFTAYAFDRTIGRLSDQWPEDTPWPEGIPRFSESDVRERKRKLAS
ncbi:hypothetical protein [Pararhizobium haloflavum]|uniref:hypothetical protein n=1 Tax=Pararhizobium haloflavum TaxID=2037914 RepID=UPI000C186155|nr:hypothetical protein [Pararhizobium haloflavum]